MSCPRCGGVMLADRLLHETACLLCSYSPENQPSSWALEQYAAARVEPRVQLPTKISLKRQPRAGLEELRKVRLR